MIPLLLVFGSSVAGGPVVPINFNQASKIAIPTVSLIVLSLISLFFYLCCGRHLADDVPLKDVMIMSDDSLDEFEESQNEEETTEVQPVIIDEL